MVGLLCLVLWSLWFSVSPLPGSESSISPSIPSNINVMKALAFQDFETMIGLRCVPPYRIKLREVAQFCYAAKLHARLRQCISDVVGSQNRKACSFFLTNLRCLSLLSRHVPKSEKESRQRKYGVQEASTKPLWKADDGKWSFAFSRTTDVSKLSATLPASDVFSFNHKVLDGYRLLYGRDVATQVIHQFNFVSVTASAYSKAGSTPEEVAIGFLLGEALTLLQSSYTSELKNMRTFLPSSKRVYWNISIVPLQSYGSAITPNYSLHRAVVCREGHSFFPVKRLKQRALIRLVSLESNSKVVFFFFRTTGHRRIVLVAVRIYRYWHVAWSWLRHLVVWT